MLNRFFLIATVSAGLSACSAIDRINQLSVSKTLPAGVSSELSGLDAKSILQNHAAAWRGVEEFALDSPIVLGIWVDGDGHTIELSNSGGDYRPGAPATFAWGFETDLTTLRTIETRSLNALTAMGQARASDPIPLSPRLPEGFADANRIRSFYIPLMLHFWNRAWPEAIAFGEGTTRQVHGANTTVLIYEEGLRSAWYQLEPGMHINEDLIDQVNEFDTAVIVTRGTFEGRIGGAERTFREGETVLVPAGIRHEFYADQYQYGEFIILMYGEGA